MIRRPVPTIALVLAVALALVVTPTLAQSGPPGPHARHGGPHGPGSMAFGAAVRILHDLELGESQRGEIHSIVQRYRDSELAALVRELGEARKAHQLNVWDPKVSLADLDATASAVADRHRKIDDVVHRMAAEVLGVLTEDQRAEFRTRLSEMPVDEPPMGGQLRMRRQAPPQGAAPER
jgi:Spy/CpxP family protein refolding chaperone